MPTKNSKTNRPNWIGSPKVTDDARAAAAKANATTSQAVRRRAIVNGLTRYASRFELSGQPEAAANIAKLAEQATTLLDARDKAEEKLAAKGPDYLATAFDAAAVELRKVLPMCFPSDSDARIFVRRLPMVDAVRAATLDIDRKNIEWRAVKKMDSRFWEIVAIAGRLATGDCDDDANFKKLLNTGR